MVQLSKDKIVVVRISLSIAIAEVLKKDPDSINLFSKVVQNLSQDIEDVREYFM